ncbi:hypothetical protein Cfor_01894 [Coptotermes formosanus]|uniref:Uncharacterized protein n=1 Tax=Coptotermes formosanus TaxID=36987 RepID=A0A6L2Q034_COPFO|nr:hypothetical protein Cfor_01894 [Coptotermes formosanus]
MLQNDFVPQILTAELPIDTQWFMQAGAMPHTANVVLDFLRTLLGGRVMSSRYQERNNGGFFWPLLSPDLNTCSYFLWGFPKEKLFTLRPADVTEMRVHIVELCNEIHEYLCHSRQKHAQLP